MKMFNVLFIGLSLLGFVTQAQALSYPEQRFQEVCGEYESQKQATQVQFSWQCESLWFDVERHPLVPAKLRAAKSSGGGGQTSSSSGERAASRSSVSKGFSVGIGGDVKVSCCNSGVKVDANAHFELRFGYEKP